MAQTIKIKNSPTPGNSPASLVAGELALNTADEKLYYMKSDGSITFVGLKAPIVTTLTVSTAILPSANNAVNIGNSSARIKQLFLGASDTNHPQINLTSGVAPTTPVDGDLWYDGTSLKLYTGGVITSIATGSGGISNAQSIANALIFG